MGQSDKHRFSQEEFDPTSEGDLTPEELDLKRMREANEYLENRRGAKLNAIREKNLKSRLSPEETKDSQQEDSREHIDPPYITQATTREQVSDILKQYKEAGYNPKPFLSSISEIIDAIFFRTEIEGTLLHERIQDPEFRFVSVGDPVTSLKLSESYAMTASIGRASGFEDGFNQGSKKGTAAAADKRIKDADEFAKNLFSIIEKLKAETGVYTIRGTVEKLNEREIESPNGGTWNTSSLQLVQKRWGTLGLVPKPKPK